MDAFDTDVLIYATSADNPLGRTVADLIQASAASGGGIGGVGSLLLVPELLNKPLRRDAEDEVTAIRRILERLELLPVTEDIAGDAATLAARYRLRTVDAVHLATAVAAGADRFITNNRRDFSKDIAEVAVVYPDEL